MTRRILATSGGFLPTDRWMVSRPGGLVLEALRLTGKDRPRVCLLETAGGDDRSTYLRRHAALAPMYLGVKAVIVKFFARIHHANLINFGIIPLLFANEADYGRVPQGVKATIPDIHARLRNGEPLELVLESGERISLAHDLSPRQIDICLAGGLLNYMRQG